MSTSNSLTEPQTDWIVHYRHGNRYLQILQFDLNYRIECILAGYNIRSIFVERIWFNISIDRINLKLCINDSIAEQNFCKILLGSGSFLKMADNILLAFLLIVSLPDSNPFPKHLSCLSAVHLIFRGFSPQRCTHHSIFCSQTELNVTETKIYQENVSSALTMLAFPGYDASQAFFQLSQNSGQLPSLPLSLNGLSVLTRISRKLMKIHANQSVYLRQNNHDSLNS